MSNSANQDGIFSRLHSSARQTFEVVLTDPISVGVDWMQRNFDPMRREVEVWQRSELPDVSAKVVIYEAFVEGKLEAPNVHGLSTTCISNRVRGIPAGDDLESVECIHVRI